MEELEMIQAALSGDAISTILSGASILKTFPETVSNIKALSSFCRNLSVTGEPPEKSIAQKLFAGERLVESKKQGVE
jgi:hypothetical protein